MIEKNRLRVILRDEVKARLFAAGFHGVGHVGWISVKHLVEKMNAERVGYIISPYMQPFVSVKKGIRTPYELYLAGDFLIFLPNVPVSPRDSNMLPLSLAELVLEVGVKEAVLFGGLDSRFKEDDSIRLAPTTAFYDAHPEVFSSGTFKPIEEGLGVVGPLAVLLSVFEVYQLPAVAVLPYAVMDRPDPRAAAEAIKAFNKIYGYNIGVEELLEEGAIVERELEEVEKKMRELAKEREPPPYHV